MELVLLEQIDWKAKTKITCAKASIKLIKMITEAIVVRFNKTFCGNIHANPGFYRENFWQTSFWHISHQTKEM